MNGIKLLLLLAASAQVEPGTERDYGWSVNKQDGVLEYIVQINPEEVRAMEQRSVAFPNGQENISNMPRELVGRATRVVTRIGTAVLPREPSLQELERTQRLFEQPNPSATAMLGPGRLQDLESNVRNIQGAVPAFPDIPNGLAGAQGQFGSPVDPIGQAASTLPNDIKGGLIDALPDSSMLAQNYNNQTGANSFLNDARGGVTGAGSKFSNTAQPANSTANPSGNTLALPPAPGGTNLSNATQGAFNGKTSGQGSGQGSGLGTGAMAGSAASQLSYPDPRLNPPSLSNQAGFPQQQTPSQGFGTSPGAGRQSSNWTAAPLNSAAPNYAPSMSQLNNSFGATPGYQQPSYQQPGYQQPSYQQPSYSPSQSPGSSTFNQGLATPQLPPEYRVATNTPPNGTVNGSLTGRQPPPTAGGGNIPLNSGVGGGGSTSSSVDGILQVLFLLSLVVNFYLGILIRKLLIRYRSLLTNVRQTAYT